MRVSCRFAVAFVAVLAAGCGPPRTEIERPVSRAAYAPRPVKTEALPAATPRPLAPLPEPPPQDPNAVALGRMLFFDNRISGDADIRCSTCHVPGRGWADGEALSTGYPGTRYFRNTKTIINAVYADYFYWDGRLGGDDPVTQVRDAINDSHFLSADARIMLQRMKQIPRYVDLFEKASLGEPDLNPIANAIVAFERTLVSRNVPLDRYLKGDQDALSAEARQGLALYQGKAGCIRCHDGPYLSDGKAHRLGVPENPEVFSDPFRVITMRSTLKFLGTPNYSNMRNDPGHFAVTKNYDDFGAFVTPTLREVARTAPYMHNGMLPTLEAVVEFYDAGGGQTDLPKDPLLEPLGLSAAEKAALVAFLRSLSGDEIRIELPQSDLPEYTLVQDWYRKTN